MRRWDSEEKHFIAEDAEDAQRYAPSAPGAAVPLMHLRVLRAASASSAVSGFIARCARETHCLTVSLCNGRSRSEARLVGGGELGVVAVLGFGRAVIAEREAGPVLRLQRAVETAMPAELAERLELVRLRTAHRGDVILDRGKAADREIGAEDLEQAQLAASNAAV